MGIGKSRLVQVLKDHLAGEPHTRLECRCSPYHTNSALYPVIDLWQRELRFETAEAPADKLLKLEQMLAQYRLPLDETVPLFAALLSLPDDRYPALALTPQQQQQKTLEALLALLVERAAQEPLLLIVEDLHWVDPSTLEFLSLLVKALAMVDTTGERYYEAELHRLHGELRLRQAIPEEPAAEACFQQAKSWELRAAGR